MSEKKNMYVVVLVDGGNDTSVKVIDQETYDWITSTNPGQPEGFNPKRDHYSWYDQIVPASQIEKLKKEFPIDPSDSENLTEEERKEHPYDYEHPHLTTGSWENDRYIMCQPADGYDEIYNTVREAAKAIRKKGDRFVDEIHGAMY